MVYNSLFGSEVVMWCLEVIKHINKPKKEEKPYKEKESQTEPRKDQTSSS